MVEMYHSDVIGCFIWEETSERRTNGTLWIRTTETSWWHTTETLLGGSFETYLRRRGDVLMRRRHYVPLRRDHDIPMRCLDDVPLRRHLVFYLIRTCDIDGLYKETLLRRCHDVSLPGGVPLRIKREFSTSFVINNFHLAHINCVRVS